MSDTYQFEHEGHTVEYFPATVRTDLAFFRYLGILLSYFGYSDGNEMSEKDPEEWENARAYATAMAQCKTDAPWRVGSVTTAREAGAAYDLYMKQEPTLRHKFMEADRATLPPKKTNESED